MDWNIFGQIVMEWNGLEWTGMDWNGFGMDVSSLDGKVPGQILLGGRLDADLVQLCRLLTVASAFQNNKYVTYSWIFPKRIRLTNFAGSGQDLVPDPNPNQK